MPKCVSGTVDEANGASHIIGIAFDGKPIHGDRDINGAQSTTADLDQCNGVSSATPEFPQGVYHDVLLDVADSMLPTRTRRSAASAVFVDESLTSIAGMAGMPGMGGPPPP